jgi:large subunit ribosomal protein L6
VHKDNTVEVKGPKGSLSRRIDPDMTVTVDNGEVKVQRPTSQKRHKALHGLSRSLINNMVKGVTEGFKQELEVVGVGFKATNEGQLLDISVGFSHDILFRLPDEVSVSTETKKGQPPRITLECTDKELLGLVASKIRSLRPPEPYKGKGVRYKGEYVRAKAGKQGK